MIDADPADSLIATMLDAALPMRIHDYVTHGGPTEFDFSRVRAVADLLAERGDTLQYKHSSDVQGTQAAIFNRLCDALAVMAFVPGGVKFCGRRWLAESGWPYWVCYACYGKGTVQRILDGIDCAPEVCPTCEGGGR